MFDIEKPINILDFKSQGLQCLILKQIKTINNLYLYLKSEGLQSWIKAASFKTHLFLAPGLSSPSPA